MCDCRIAWVFREPKFKKIRYNKPVILDLHTHVKCGSPSNHKGKRLSDLKESDVCHKSKKLNMWLARGSEL